MRLTKYEHACFSLEKDGKLLIVDPGVLATSLGTPENVIAIVVTHEHADHFDPHTLSELAAHNPEAVIYAHETVTKQLESPLPTQAVTADETVVAGPFGLEFFGGEHAVIHKDIPVVANLGVMINNIVYYPGDSFTLPGKAVDVLALPVGAPWLKISEAFDFLTAVKPRFAFPTHDGVLSDFGKGLPDRMMPQFAKSVGTVYQRLTGPVDIDG